MAYDKLKRERIKDIGHVVTGKTPPTARKELFGDDFPFITPTDIKNFDTRYLLSTDRGLSLRGYEYQLRYLLPRNAVCYVCIGSTIGKMCLTARESFTNQQINSLIVNEQFFDPMYVFYLLRTVTPRIQTISGGSGSGKAILNKSSFEQIEVDVHPPRSTQRKIAAILSAYDDLIENNTRRIKILEEMAQLIYREWFVHFRFPGHENVRMVESELGPIPEGWEVKKFGDVVDLVREGVNPIKFADETFAHLSIPAFDEDAMPILERGETIKSGKYLVPSDCILLSKINPRIPRTWLPFLDDFIRAVASTEFLPLVPRPPLSRFFVFALISTPEFLGEFAGRALGTSTSHQRVKPEDFLNMQVLVPSEPVARKYADSAEPLFTLAHKLRVKNANLRLTQDLLLPRLISGEIDVENLDIDTGAVSI